MQWTRKSQTGEMYCSVHNVDCPLHSHPGDPMVLEVSPGMVPSSWVCPQAVDEIAQWEEEAETHMDSNDVSGAGVVFPSAQEEIIAEALRMDGFDDDADIVRADGAEALDHRALDRATTAIEAHQDDLPREAETIHQALMEVANG